MNSGRGVILGLAFWSAIVVDVPLVFADEANIRSRTVISEIRMEPATLFTGARAEAVATQSYVLVGGYVSLNKGDSYRRLRLTYSSEYLKTPVVVLTSAKAGSVFGVPGAFVNDGALSSCWRRKSGVGEYVGSGSPISVSVAVEDLGAAPSIDASLPSRVIKKRAFRKAYPENADNPGEVGNTIFVLESKRKFPIRISLTSRSPLGRSTFNIIVPVTSDQFALQGDWSKADVAVSSSETTSESC
jgi:hypothetical protein